MLENGVLDQNAWVLPVEPMPHASQPSRSLIPDDACAGPLSTSGTTATVPASSTALTVNPARATCALQRMVATSLVARRRHRRSGARSTVAVPTIANLAEIL